jgi:hypothetical protein
MQVQVNVIFDLETEADRVAVMTRIDDMLRMSGVKADVVPLAGNGADEAPMRVGGGVQQASDVSPPKAPAPGRVAAAANARAAKQAQQAQQQKIQAGDTQVNSLASAADLAGANGAADADTDDDALGLNSPSMSPGEAKDAALALVREAYSAGHVAQVKALQKELGVAKFYDVDVTTGHAFYQRVMKLAHEVGIRR